MAHDDERERDPQQAIDEIREKAGEGKSPSEEEREFLESEGVPLEPEESGGRPVP